MWKDKQYIMLQLHDIAELLSRQWPLVSGAKSKKALDRGDIHGTPSFRPDIQFFLLIFDKRC